MTPPRDLLSEESGVTPGRARRTLRATGEGPPAGSRRGGAPRPGVGSARQRSIACGEVKGHLARGAGTGERLSFEQQRGPIWPQAIESASLDQVDDLLVLEVGADQKVAQIHEGPIRRGRCRDGLATQIADQPQPEPQDWMGLCLLHTGP